ncbi:MAG: TIGR04282 family arsenosugar biosynthesis glycosyltransferase [Mariprofundus sp.]
MRQTDIQVIIMCKAPVAGRVKTRLMASYSAEQAAALHRAMARTVIHRAKRLFSDVVIAADDPPHPFFASFDLPCRPQGEGDLGDRMTRQVACAFADGVKAVMLLGTDSPQMPDARLLAATTALPGCDVVLGPVEDGGYDLLAMRRPLPVFAEVSWSSGEVLAQTLAHIEQLGLSVEQLETGFDVDFPADIERARQCGWQPDDTQA